MIQSGFFDPQDRLYKIDKNGDPLTKINQTVNWEIFRPALEKARYKSRKSNLHVISPLALEAHSKPKRYSIMGTSS